MIRPRTTEEREVTTQVDRTIRRVALKNYFFHQPQIGFPLGFQASGSQWTPHDAFSYSLRGFQLPPFLVNTGVRLNLTRTQKQTLRDIANRPDILVVMTDKNLGLALIETSEYNRRMRLELQLTPQAFGTLNHSVQQHQWNQRSLIGHISQILGATIQHPMRDRILKFINEPFQRCDLKRTKVFGMPKLHKAGQRMRLVFPMSSHPMGPLHKFIASCLTHLPLKYDSVIFHVLEIVHNLAGRSLPGHLILFKADIATMYPSADMTMVRQALTEIIQRQPEMLQFIPGIDLWDTLIRSAHKDLEFEFEGTLRTQETGVPIGSPCGPPLAILTLHHSIRNEFVPTRNRIHALTLGMYFDDIFGIADAQPEEIRQEITHLVDNNSCFSVDGDSFEFSTIQDLESKPINFLDIELYAQPDPMVPNNYILLCRPYCKPIGAYQYVPWRSAHPPSIKRSIIHGELCRRQRLCSTIQDWGNTITDLRKKLMDRGYPMKIIQQEEMKFTWDPLHRSRYLTLTKLAKRRNSPFRWIPTPTAPIPRCITPIVITYDPRVHASIKLTRRQLQTHIDSKIMNNWQVRICPRVVVAYQVGRKLLHILQHPNPLLTNPHQRETNPLNPEQILAVGTSR